MTQNDSDWPNMRKICWNLKFCTICFQGLLKRKCRYTGPKPFTPLTARSEIIDCSLFQIESTSLSETVARYFSMCITAIAQLFQVPLDIWVGFKAIIWSPFSLQQQQYQLLLDELFHLAEEIPFSQETHLPPVPHSKLPVDLVNTNPVWLWNCVCNIILFSFALWRSHLISHIEIGSRILMLMIDGLNAFINCHLNSICMNFHHGWEIWGLALQCFDLCQWILMSCLDSVADGMSAPKQSYLQCEECK